MGKTLVKNMDTSTWENELMQYMVNNITGSLCEYAKEKIQEIGQKFLSYNRANNLDRSGNLLNSLCWGVTYDGELKGSGFYRSPVTRTVTVGRKYKQERTLKASLHEFSWYAEPVDGRALAEEFLNGRVPAGKKKWKVFFAVLAPYWGYWESGFTMVKNGMFLKFAVMTQLYDEVKRELKNPSEMQLTISRDRFYSFGENGNYRRGRRK